MKYFLVSDLENRRPLLIVTFTDLQQFLDGPGKNEKYFFEQISIWEPPIKEEKAKLEKRIPLIPLSRETGLDKPGE